MENMDKGLTVPKWVLMNWPKIPKIPQMPQNLSRHIVYPRAQKFGISIKKKTSLGVRCPWIEPTKYYSTAARPARTLSKAVIADL